MNTDRLGRKRTGEEKHQKELNTSQKPKRSKTLTSPHEEVLVSVKQYTEAMQTLSLLEHPIVHSSQPQKTHTLQTSLTEHIQNNSSQESMKLKTRYHHPQKGPIEIELNIHITKTEQPYHKVIIQDSMDTPYSEVYLDVTADNSSGEPYVLVGKAQLKISGKHIKPRALQMRAIEAFVKALSEGQTSQLLLMGTGTGKSFVGAGIGLALNQGVYIVPTQAHAAEMKKDAIETIRKGTNTYPEVCIGSEITLENFKTLINTTGLDDRYVILEMDDKDFAAKTALLEGQFVLIDEAHQFTSNDPMIKILQKLQNDNIVLALTGTPTPKLFSMLGNPVDDINLRAAQDAGAVREMCIMNDIAYSHDIIERIAAHYFGSWALKKGDKVHYFSEMKLDQTICETPGALTKVLMPIINAALQQDMPSNHLLRNDQQKNFIFSEDKGLRADIVKYFEELYHSAVSSSLDAAVLNKIAQCKAAQSKVLLEAFYHHVTQSGFTLTPETKQELAKAVDEQYRVKLGSRSVENVPKKNFREQMMKAQKDHIAQTVLASALYIVLDVKHSECEKFIRTKTVKELVAKEIAQCFEQEIRQKLQALYPALPEIQKNALDHLITECIHNVRSILSDPSGSIDTKAVSIMALLGSISERIDLSNLQARYIDQISKDDNDRARRAPVLDQFRAGLIMQLVSDSVFATGISIPSVLSTQQTITCQADLDALYIMQLFGRCIRDKDEFAFVYQAVKFALIDSDYLKAEHLISDKAGMWLKLTQERRDQVLTKFAELRVGMEAAVRRLNFFQSAPSKPKPSDPVERLIPHSLQKK